MPYGHLDHVDLSKPYDLSSFSGRLKYFFWVTDYRTVLTSNQKLYAAKEIVEKHEKNETDITTSEDDLWQAKRLQLSSFHPDSGELQNFIGRMSFQVPGGMVITAGMLQFYKSTGAVILWQWINQSFNALVNYTNRNAESEITTTQMAVSYISATSSAVLTAILFKRFLAKRATNMFQRFVPFFAVAAANMVNIPLSRQSELKNGIMMRDENGQPFTRSKLAALKGISQVTFSRIIMAAPGMLLMPFIMESFEKKFWFRQRPYLHLPFQTFMIGIFLTIMVPIACALFSQKSSLVAENLKYLDNQEYEKLKTIDHPPKILYFNKGL